MWINIYIHTLPFIEICNYLYIWHNMYISACWWVLRARSIVVSLRDKEKLEGQLKQPYFTQAVLAANYMTISFSVLFRRLKRWFLRSSVEISRTSEARPPRQLLVTSARFGHRNLRPPCHARASSSRLHWQWGKRFWFFWAPWRFRDSWSCTWKTIRLSVVCEKVYQLPSVKSRGATKTDLV